MTSGFDVDPETLRAYANGPLADAMATLEAASQQLGGQPPAGAYPAVAQGAASAQGETTRQAQQTVAEAARMVENIAERLRRTADVYAGAEDVNTRSTGTA